MKIPFTNYEIRAERRPRPSAWDDFWYTRQGEDSSSGINVSEDNALGYSAIWACVKVISEDLASLPLILYSKSGKSRDRAENHPLYGLLHDAPNPEMTSMQFREALQAHLLTWGNAYAEIQRNLRGTPIALWPLNPGQMKVTRDDGNELIYEYRLQDNPEPIILQKRDVFHIAGLGFNGLIGYSPITYHREAVGVGLAAQQMQGANYRNGGRLSMALVHPAAQAPKQEGRDKLRDELRKEYGGPQNAGKIAVFWEGMKPTPMSMSLEDQQFIESRKFTRSEIASIYRVPPHKIMDLERATFSNIEQQNISYVVDTIRPWATRWEQAVQQRLLDGSAQYYVEHLVDGLMRGDIKSRNESYAIARQWGWMSINDIRQKENMNPIPDGDAYLEPMNMRPVGSDAMELEQSISEEEKERAAVALRRLHVIRS